MVPSALVPALLAFCALPCLGVQAAEKCYDDYSPGSYIVCTNGCCGWDYSYCCAEPEYDTAAIVGIVVGCIVVISIIIAVVCCCIKANGGQSERVVHPQGQPSHLNVNLFYTGTGGPQPQPQPQPGPAYSTQPMGPQPVAALLPNKGMELPPAYNYSDPAYLPGAASGGSNPSGTNSGPLDPPPPAFNTA